MTSRTWRICATLLSALFLTGPVSAAVQNPEFSIPLRFDVVGDGVELPAPELEYDLSHASVLRVGSQAVSVRNLSAKLLPADLLDARFRQFLSPLDKKEFFFLFQWPEDLVPEGQLEMISRSGRVLWKTDINANSKARWQRHLQSWRKSLKAQGLAPDDVNSAAVFKISFGVSQNLNSPRNPFMATREPFRFCLTQNQETGFSRFCTLYYEVRRSTKNIAMTLMPVSAAPPRVILFNESAKLKDVLPVTPGQTVSFYAELDSGLSYEFVSQPMKLNLVEMTSEPGSKIANLISWGAKPYQSVVAINVEDEDFLTKTLGLQQTIGDMRKFWQTSIELRNPTLYTRGSAGGIFRQRLLITKLPSESMRPYVSRRTVEGTYIDGVKVFGQVPENVELRTKQNAVSVSKNKTDFTWYFQARHRDQMNKSYLIVRKDDQEFRTYSEIFKGYPRELSFRLSGILSSEGNVVFMGEGAFNYWFEDFFGWTHYYLARQRWGLSVKYFQSIGDFAFSRQSDTLLINTVDLKYRLTPGLWNRDETLGVILGTQKFNYYQFDAHMLGVGAFWARSMPKVFDDLFNILWFMRYPKWVDMEFIYYLVPLSPDTKLKMNFALNFHGKVMWKYGIFGEAGFGVKQYDFDDTSPSKGLNMRFGALYGTAGLGLNF